jgi:CheY-like chemotaxis protein
VACSRDHRGTARKEEPKGARVLVVDDDPLMLDLVGGALADEGYRVSTASNGELALEQVEKEKPELVLLDMTMPVMDGWTFAKRLRDRHGRSIPIIVITAAQDSQLRADEVGAEGELGKPFEMQRLYEVVEDTLASDA